MEALAGLVHSGRLIDIALVLMAMEVAGLALYRRLTGRGPRMRAVLPLIGAGAALMLALRAALVGAGWGWIVVCLTLGLAAHVVDVRGRWR